MTTRTRLFMAAALIIIALSLACGFGDGCPAGTSATWHCSDTAETCWQVCE